MGGLAILQALCFIFCTGPSPSSFASYPPLSRFLFPFFPFKGLHIPSPSAFLFLEVVRLHIQLGGLESAVSSPNWVWAGVPAKIEFDALLL